MTRNVGVLLSGCGFLDGSEIHEAVLTMLSLDRRGAQRVCIAPRAPQRDVVDHAAKAPTAGEPRNMLAEAARIARARITDLADVRVDSLDALILPGGFGAAKNLSDFALAGARAEVRGDVARLLRAVHAAGKPIGAICIAPAVVAGVFGRELHPVLTIGDDAGTAEALRTMGATHRTCPVTDCVVDAANRIVTTPAYMYDARIGDVATGIDKLVAAVLAMCDAGRAAGSAS